MHEFIRTSLRQQRAVIRSRWEVLLRIERAPTPLALPDTLVHLFDHTFEEILQGLSSTHRTAGEPRPEAQCDCNPMRVYFAAFEQAVMEALILAQAEETSLSQEDRNASVRDLSTTVRRIARKEIALYDGLCQQKRPVDLSS
jgi:hypothetical protein